MSPQTLWKSAFGRWEEAEWFVDRLTKFESRIRDIHAQDFIPGPSGAKQHPTCSECFHSWPCPTIQALDEAS